MIDSSEALATIAIDTATTAPHANAAARNGGGSGSSRSSAMITIKNGTVRGFFMGIFLEGVSSQGHVVEDIRADQNTYVGIFMDGSGNLVRNNQVVATGGTTFFGAVANGVGIWVQGSGARVINNSNLTSEQTSGMIIEDIRKRWAQVPK